MKITLESTSQVVAMYTENGAGRINARLWQGRTSTGVPVMALIPRVAPMYEEGDARLPVAEAEFERDLIRAPLPPQVLRDFPTRLIV